MRKTKLALKLRSPKLKCWFAPQVYLDCMVCWSCIIWKKFPILPKGMLNPPPPTGTFNHFNKEMGGGGYRSFPFPCELQVGFFFSWSTEEVRAIFPCTSVLQKDHEVREVRVLFMNYGAIPTHSPTCGTWNIHVVITGPKNYTVGLVMALSTGKKGSHE